MTTLLETENAWPLCDDAQPGPGQSLTLAAGRLLCLVGPNGSGKTAWLRMLAGVDPATQGRVRLLGTDIASLDTAAWRTLRRRAAFIAEGAPLLSVLDGLGNVTLPALYHRLGSQPDMAARAREWLDFLDYPGATDALPANLNQHQRLLLAIARCLMLSPEVIFLDEPFHMTDEACRSREAAIYRRLVKERGLSVVVATHNLGFVKRHADDILFVHAQGIELFSGWDTFTTSPHSLIHDFLRAA